MEKNYIIKIKHKHKHGAVITTKVKITFHYTMSQKCAKLFLLELCLRSTKFDNFWQTGGQEDKNV